MSRELTAEEREWIEEWLPRLPMRVAREAVYETLGGLIKPQTLNNADSAGSGPAVRYLFGRKKVVYDMRDLLEWFVRKHGLIRRQDLAGMVESIGSRHPGEATKGAGARNEKPSKKSYAA
jgi:hypothetical protein